MSDVWQLAFITAWFSFRSAQVYMQSEDDFAAERRRWCVAQADLAIAGLDLALKERA